MHTIHTHTYVWTYVYALCLPEHHTAMSSEWPQLLSPHSSWRQSAIESSNPVHTTSSNKMGPSPPPIRLVSKVATAYLKFSWRHTTFVFIQTHSSSQTVPHNPPYLTSTRPSIDELPPASLNVIFEPGNVSKVEMNSRCRDTVSRYTYIMLLYSDHTHYCIHAQCTHHIHH